MDIIYCITPIPFYYWNWVILWEPGPLFTKMTSSYGYRYPHDKPQTVWRPSQVYNGNPYTDKTASSLSIEAQVNITAPEIYPIVTTSSVPIGIWYAAQTGHCVPWRVFFHLPASSPLIRAVYKLLQLHQKYKHVLRIIIWQLACSIR